MYGFVSSFSYILLTDDTLYATCTRALYSIIDTSMLSIGVRFDVLLDFVEASFMSAVVMLDSQAFYRLGLVAM